MMYFFRSVPFTATQMDLSSDLCHTQLHGGLLRIGVLPSHHFPFGLVVYVHRFHLLDFRLAVP